MHYIRTFFKALQMTMRGETIPEPSARYPNLQNWIIIARKKLEAVYTETEKSGIDEAQRQAITLQLDGRPWTMDLILSSVKFHLDVEFPSLMESVVEHNLTTLYALHFDDKYRISQLGQSTELPESLRPVMEDFSAHFLNIPSSTNP